MNVLSKKHSHPNNRTGMIIKYDIEGNIEWGKAVGGDGEDQITCIIETSEGGYLVGGYFKSSSIDLGNGVVLKNNVATSYRDGMIIKYGESGEVEWGKVVEGRSNDYINCIIGTQDGGYVIGGALAS